MRKDQTCNNKNRDKKRDRGSEVKNKLMWLFLSLKHFIFGAPGLHFPWILCLSLFPCGGRRVGGGMEEEEQWEGEGERGEGEFGKECVEFISCSAALRVKVSEESESWPNWKLWSEHDEGALTPLLPLDSSSPGRRRTEEDRGGGGGTTMAEPLLKRTFSRLRGKDRSRRKTDPKLSGEQLQTLNILFVKVSERCSLWASCTRSHSSLTQSLTATPEPNVWTHQNPFFNTVSFECLFYFRTFQRKSVLKLISHQCSSSVKWSSAGISSDLETSTNIMYVPSPDAELTWNCKAFHYWLYENGQLKMGSVKY